MFDGIDGNVPAPSGLDHSGGQFANYRLLRGLSETNSS
jgi:hypothetical protein